MVLFVDFAADVEHPDASAGPPRGAPAAARELPSLNNNAMTRALACYPVVSQIAADIDLNTLDNLARSCRQIHSNLLQFRAQLVAQTLRCANEALPPDPAHSQRFRARASDWYFTEDGGGAGKAGPCARDLVGECRRCGDVVCRNCSIKPPAPVLLAQRHRRLCKACIRAPLASLVPSAAVLRAGVCHCAEAGVWLCQPCGRYLRNADATYKSIWQWRKAYGPSLGGLGTGIGEGDRGVGCGRAAECLAAHEVEEETDCDAADARVLNSADATPERDSPSPDWMGPGYARHEIEGIGGVVKKKLVRMVRIGAGVGEYEDEKRPGSILERERTGRNRSWCGWCWRVIPGVKDGAQL